MNKKHQYLPSSICSHCMKFWLHLENSNFGIFLGWVLGGFNSQWIMGVKNFKENIWFNTSYIAEKVRLWRTTNRQNLKIELEFCWQNSQYSKNLNRIYENATFKIVWIAVDMLKALQTKYITCFRDPKIILSVFHKKTLFLKRVSFLD